MNAPIEIERLTKQYRSAFGKKTTAVQDVSFSIREGETVGLIGQNGAGKTTTLKALMGYIRPTSGETRIFGTPSGQPEARRGLGFVPENAAFYDFLTPMQSMRAILTAHRVELSSPAEHCLSWMDKLGIADAANRPIRFLSKGMTQRLALAQALAIGPKVLVLDEPLSGLDPGGRMEVVEALQRYRSDGGTILFSSHVLFDVERLADRFVMVDRGQLKADMSMREVESRSQSLRIRSAGDAPADFLRQDGDRHWIGEIGRGHLNERLTQLMLLGHDIIEVRPIMNLETLYLSLAKTPSREA